MALGQVIAVAATPTSAVALIAQPTRTKLIIQNSVTSADNAYINFGTAAGPQLGLELQPGSSPLILEEGAIPLGTVTVSANNGSTATVFFFEI